MIGHLLVFEMICLSWAIIGNLIIKRSFRSCIA